ncbi:ATP-binding cassette domain-containing protein [Sulfitobacter sp.]|nr:ATP-binding cassette domain-containing protein [Sulfitobacter sp.]
MNSRTWLWGPLRENLPSLKAAILATILSFVLQIFVSLFPMVIYNKIIPNSAIESMITIVLGIFLVIIFDFFFKLIKTRLVDAATSRMEISLQKSLYNKIISWDLQNIPKLTGSSAALTRDLDNVAELFTSSSITVLVGLPFVFVNLAVIYVIGAELAFVATTICCLIFLLSLFYYFLISAHAEKAKNANIEKTSVFIETLNNLETIKSVGDYNFFKKRWNEALSKNNEVSSKLKKDISDSSSFQALITSLGQIALLATGGFMVINNHVSAGALFATVILNGRTVQPLLQLSNVLTKYSTAKASISKLDNVFNSVSTEEKRRENIRFGEIKGPIVIRNLTFAPQNAQYSILNIPSLKIPNKQKVGIVGSVGSGKSTFVKLISGVYTPSEGNITYGAYDISALHQSDFRENVVYLGQNVGIFSGTIRENLCVGREDIDDDELGSALRLSGFETILKKFPNGLSFTVSEGGRELSGGQRQILALARAFISNPNVIILDEPTSAMDPRHENLFVKNLGNFTKDKTFIVVTHRKPILSIVDRILVIEEGKVILDGPSNEVLKKFA